MWTLDDVIAAIASPPGAGRRGIVRVAGPNVQSVVQRLIVPQTGTMEALSGIKRPTRVSALLTVRGLSMPLPVELFVWPTSRSYPGQPTVEIHAVGSPPILEAVIQSLVEQGARVSRPGEFTLRAFLAGKIDLVQAEAVLGVIDADSTRRLQQALTQLAGGISSRMRELREQLLIDLADLEAGLDFVEEDIEFVDRAAMTNRLRAAVDWIADLQRHSEQRGQSATRPRVVLAGPPNAGKSTLFNALAGHEAAVVSPEAGTTRDWLVATIDFDGFQFDVVDTAGAEDGTDEIGRQAQEARRRQLEEADLVLWCTPADSDPFREDVLLSAMGFPDRLLNVSTKADLGTPSGSAEVIVSAASGQGISQLRAAIHHRLAETGETGELLSTSLSRCAETLAAAHEALSRAADHSASGGGEELVALELRAGLKALGEIAGVVYTDDLLNRIFSRFCIGK